MAAVLFHQRAAVDVNWLAGGAMAAPTLRTIVSDVVAAKKALASAAETPVKRQRLAAELQDARPPRSSDAKSNGSSA